MTDHHLDGRQPFDPRTSTRAQLARELAIRELEKTELEIRQTGVELDRVDVDRRRSAAELSAIEEQRERDRASWSVVWLWCERSLKVVLPAILTAVGLYVALSLQTVKHENEVGKLEDGKRELESKAGELEERASTLAAERDELEAERNYLEGVTLELKAGNAVLTQHRQSLVDTTRGLVTLLLDYKRLGSGLPGDDRDAADKLTADAYLQLKVLESSDALDPSTRAMIGGVIRVGWWDFNTSIEVDLGETGEDAPDDSHSVDDDVDESGGG